MLRYRVCEDARLRHRGPDGSGVWLSEDRSLGFAHTRLAILDVEVGTNRWCTRRLRDRVQRRDLQLSAIATVARTQRSPVSGRAVTPRRSCTFTRSTDATAFSISTGCSHSRYGTRTMRSCSLRVIASVRSRSTSPGLAELRVRFRDQGSPEHPALVREVNEAVLDAYLANLVTSSPATLFKGVQKLPPGFRGICTSRGVEIEPYWSVFAPRTSPQSRSRTAQSVRSASSNQCRSGC